MDFLDYEDEFYFAERIRECWRLWNQGFPCVRPIGYRKGKVWYSESLTDEKTDIDPVHVFSFLVDLFRLGEMGIVGRYEVRVTEDQRTPFLRLVPADISTSWDTNLKHHLIDLASQTLAISKIGYNLDHDLDFESPSLDNFYDFNWIVGYLKGLEIRAKIPGGEEYFDGSCFIEIHETDEGRITVVLNIENRRYRILSGIHGNIYIRQVDPGTSPLLTFPARCTSYSSSPEWSKALTRWGQNLFSAESEQGEIQKNILLTLEAEIENEQKYCVQYTIENEFKPQGGWIRIHPSRARINAHTYWDMGVDSGDMYIALNQSSDVREWSDDDKWLMVNIDDSDPFKLMVRPLKEGQRRSPSDFGFLKPANIGTTSLLQRKQTIVEEGIKRNTLITEPAPYPDSDFFGFMARLKTQGTLQLIQGPPGTGKTWTAAKIVEDVLEWNPAYRILLSAKEHLALDHLCQTVGETL